MREQSRQGGHGQLVGAPVSVALVVLAILALSAFAVAWTSSSGPPAPSPLPRAAPAPVATVVDASLPAFGSAAASPPHLTEAITNWPKTIYTYKNEQEQNPQDSQVSLFANASGAAVGSYANVQVVFVVETTLYDGVYDPTQDDTGVNNPCDGPCEESDGVPFFVANAGQIAQDISDNNPYSTVTFAMVDYFATLTDHDDGDGAEYHVDVPNFVAANKFQADVTSGFQTPVLGGNWYYFDSDFSDCILGSSEITALYGALVGSGLGWTPGDHHVIVIMGSTAPRDPGYVENYAYTHSDDDSGTTTTCEPSYDYGGGVSSPNCERWIQGSQSVAALANSSGVNIDYIDLSNGVVNGSSQDYTQKAGGTADATTILNAGCAMAVSTGGSWEGPPGYQCSAAETGTGYGNLTCSMGSSCFQGQSGGAYNNPPRSWVDNTPLGWALTHISFGPTSVSNVTATGNGAPMFQFVPSQNITPDPSNPGWKVTCLHNGAPVSGCQQSPTITSSGSANVYGWNWPTGTMVLNDTWKATFNVVANGGPFNTSYPLDACTDTGCLGTVGSGAYSLVTYKNFQGTPTTTSFPPSDIYVVYPGMTVSVSPPYSRGTVGFTQSFLVSASGGQPPYSFQWYLCTGSSSCTAQGGATSSSFSYTFTTPGTFTVRCLVFDQYNPSKGVSGTAQVVVTPSLGSLFSVEGNITSSATGSPVSGALVSLNGTLGSTYAAANGSYLLGSIPNGSYLIYVNATGYHPYQASITVSGNTWVNVALSVAPPSTYPVQGYLTSFASGAPVVGGHLTLSYFGTTYGTATTSASGYYVMPSIFNATYTLVATGSGYYPANLTVVVAGAGVWANLSLTPLPPQLYYITGTVLNNISRSPVVGASVVVNQTLLNTTTDTNGIFLFLNVPNGTYTLTISAAGYYAQSIHVRVYGAGVSRTVILSALPPVGPPSWTLAGTVLSAATHLPVPNATITVNGTTGKVIATAQGSTSGDYVVDGLTNATYSAVASAPGYVAGGFSFPINGSSWVENFYLTPQGGGQYQYVSIEGAVLDAVNTTQAISDATVSLTPSTLSSTVTSTDGIFLFPRVPASTSGPEDLTLTVSAPGYRWSNQTLAVGTANIDITVFLVPTSLQLYTVTGVVDDKASGRAVGGANVSILDSPFVIPSVRTNSLTGGFSFQEVPGTYELEASAAGYSPGFVNVSLTSAAVNGVVIYLRPHIAGSSTPTSNPNQGIFSPGYDGLYLQLWVPAVAGLLAFAYGFVIYRRRRHHLPPRAPPEPVAEAPATFSAGPGPDPAMSSAAPGVPPP